MQKETIDRFKSKRDPEKFKLRLEKERLIAKLEDLTESYEEKIKKLVESQERREETAKKHRWDYCDDDYKIIQDRELTYIGVVRDLKELINS